MPSKDETNNREDGAVLLEENGPVAVITLSRPEALNALTWVMYQQMESHLEYLLHNEVNRVVIIRGEGNAFAAGTDISQFQGFTASDGLIYEQKMETIIEKLYHFPRPVIAAIHGYAVGAGIILSSACDLRFATPASRFGAPIARTLGNALSLKNYQHLERSFGVMKAKEMLFTARLLTADEALQSGFLTAIIEKERLFTHANTIAQQISTLAPLTIWATKQAHQRLREAETMIPFDDVLARIYESQDFAEGVKAYVEKRKPQWQGR